MFFNGLQIWLGSAQAQKNHCLTPIIQALPRYAPSFSTDLSTTFVENMKSLYFSTCYRKYQSFLPSGALFGRSYGFEARTAARAGEGINFRISAPLEMAMRGQKC